jgi:hypothetical protein
MLDEVGLLLFYLRVVDLTHWKTSEVMWSESLAFEWYSFPSPRLVLIGVAVFFAALRRRSLFSLPEGGSRLTLLPRVVLKEYLKWLKGLGIPRDSELRIAVLARASSNLAVSL